MMESGNIPAKAVPWRILMARNSGQENPASGMIRLASPKTNRQNPYVFILPTRSASFPKGTAKIIPGNK
jgi:hypothetical protein